MSSERPPDPEPEATQVKARPRKAGRLQARVGGLVLVVACCAFISWAARTVWEELHPAIGAARGFRSRDPAGRVSAASALVLPGLTDPGRAIPPLVAALKDTEGEVRVAAADALRPIVIKAVSTGSGGDAVRDAITGLIGSLKDPDPATRIAAIFILSDIASTKGASGAIDLEEVVAAFGARLDDREEEVRLAALYALGRCGPLVSADPPAAIVGALDDRSARNRAAAVSALASFSCNLDPWLPLILRGVEEGEPPVRDACQRALGRFPPPAVSAAAIPTLVAALGSRSRDVRNDAARALRPHARDPRAAVAIPALLALLREPIDLVRVNRLAIDWNYVQGDPAQRAAEVLGKIAPGTKSAGEVIAALADVVRSDHPSRRGSAAYALGEFGPAAEPAIPALIHSLRDAIAGKVEDPFFDGYAAAWRWARSHRARSRLTTHSRS